MAKVKAEPTVMKKDERERMQNRLDTLENLVSGLGVAGRDMRMGGRITWKARMTEQDAEDMYAGDGLARRIVELLPSEATREWIEFDDENEDIEEALHVLDVRNKFYKADVAARNYGGACLFLDTGEARKNLFMPLDMKGIKELKGLVLMTMHELQGGVVDIDNDLSSRNYGYPRTYQLMDRRGATNPKPLATIHHTRLIRFDGADLPLQAFIRNNFWHDSVLTACSEALVDFLQSYGGVANVMNNFRLISYKVKGLAEAVAAGEEQAIMDRLKLVNKARTLLGMTVLDAEEELDVHADTFAGVKDILESFKTRLAMTTGYPQMILFQDSPGGLNSSGNSELEGWYNTVSHYQGRVYKPKLAYLLKVLYASKKGPTRGAEPANDKFHFKKLWQQSEKEAAEAYNANATGDAAYNELGALDVSDIIKKRFPEKAAEMGDAALAAMDEAIAEAKQAQQEAMAQAAANPAEPGTPKDGKGAPAKDEKKPPAKKTDRKR